jgi:hypothetical protein
MKSVSPHGTGPRFLIADDHAVFVEILRVYLEKTYTVVPKSGVKFSVFMEICKKIEVLSQNFCSSR